MSTSADLPFAFGAPPARRDALRVILPAHAAPEAIFDAYSQALDLPAWFGRNLDALFDALCDQPRPVLVVHEGLPDADADWIDRYLTTLIDAIDQLEPEDLVVNFPEVTAAAVRAALRG